MTRRSVSVSLAAIVAAVLLPACTTVETAPAAPATAEAPRQVLQGSVLYRDKTPLPDDAKVKVQLVDVLAEPMPVVVAETLFGSGGKQVPLTFALPIEMARVKEGRSYALRAYIEYGGSTRYVTTARVNVNPYALPTTVAILLIPGTADKPVTDSAPPPGAMRPVQPSRSTLPRGSGRQGK